MSAPAPTSPFKFLDAYGAQDSAIFFGRDEEIETLYRLLTESRMVMVYGQSGTGKTSLVQCGLTHKFSATNWLPLTVRRGDDLGASLDQVLKAAAITPLKDGASTVEAVRSVYLDHLRPVFLIFDQFEELYVLGTNAEQEAFYAAVKTILEADVSCRVIVLLREEYLAALDPFERAVPSLFDKRLRVEVMTNSNVEKVILGTCAANGIVLEHGLDTARLIIAQLDDKHVGVQLAYLQVYLDHLYRHAAPDGGPVTFTDAAIAEAGKLGDIMAGFLDEQEAAIQAELGAAAPAGGVARLLEEFVSAEGTKQPSTYDEVLSRVPSSAPWLQRALELLQNSRLLRRVDNHYELAHDALATRIAERRSGESKQLLMVEALVRNRLAEFPQTRNRLNADELGLIVRASKVTDPLDGSPRLKLDKDQVEFVKQCRRANRWRRFRWIGLIGAAILGGAGFGIYILAQWQSADDNAANASNVADALGFSTYLYLRGSSDPTARELAAWQHTAVAYANINREVGDERANDPAFTESEGAKTFWWRLYDADTRFDGTHDGEGVKIYRGLENEMRSRDALISLDAATLGKSKAVLWHHYFITGQTDDALAKELFDLMDTAQSGIGYDALGFEDDLITLCEQYPAYKAIGEDKCERHRRPGGVAPTPEPSPTETGATNAPPPAIKY